MRIIVWTLLAVTVALLALVPFGLGPKTSHVGSAIGSLHAASTPARTLAGSHVATQPGSLHSGAASRPAATISLGDSGRTPTAIGLNWTPTNDFTFSSYTVMESPNGSAGSFSSVAVVTTQSTTSVTVGGLSPSNEYWWQVDESGLFGGSTSNTINATQPTLAYLNFTTPTASSAWFNWSNNASYGGLLTFGSYEVFEAVGTGTATLEATITNASDRSWNATGLLPGSSYRVFVNTTDCGGSCTGTGSQLFVTQSNVVTLGTPLPLAATLVESRAVVDVGENDLFTCTPSGGSAPFSFAWDYGNGTYLAGTSSVAHAFGLATNATVICRVTDGTRSTTSPAIAVTVNPAPTLLATLNRTTADEGQLVAFSCLPSNGTPPFAVGWSFGDGIQASGGYLTHAYGVRGSLVATCAATDGAGVTVVRWDSVNISSDPSVVASASTAAAAPGTPVNFRDVASNGSGGFSAGAWSFSDGGSASGATVNHTFLSAGNFTASVLVSDSNGGVAHASVPVHVERISVVITVTDLNVTQGTTVSYSARASGGSGSGYNFSWTFPTGAIYGPNLTYNYTTAGTFSPLLRVSDGLGATDNVSAPTETVTAPPAPPPSFTIYYVVAAVIVLAVLAIALGLVYRRRALESKMAGQIGRIPPTDPNEVRRGAKVCRFCGTSNLPLRDTCASCGRPLRRGLA